MKVDNTHVHALYLPCSAILISFLPTAAAFNDLTQKSLKPFELGTRSIFSRGEMSSSSEEPKLSEYSTAKKEREGGGKERGREGGGERKKEREGEGERERERES